MSEQKILWQNSRFPDAIIKEIMMENGYFKAFGKTMNVQDSRIRYFFALAGQSMMPVLFASHIHVR